MVAFCSVCQQDLQRQQEHKKNALTHPNINTPKHKWKHTIVRNYLEPLVSKGKETNG